MLRTIDRNRYFSTALFALLCVSAVFFIIIFPDRIFQASLQGLDVWWQIVFPALLPFFILTELLASYRFFHKLGKFFQPMMKLLFRLPGEAAWAFISGLSAGFPTGALATVELRRKGRLTLNQSEQLLALSHFCSPILLMHVVAVGFFGDVRLGWILIAIHLISLIITGILLRGKSVQVREQDPAVSEQPTEQVAELDAGFGKMLGDAVMTSIQRLMGIGGVMMVFAVTIELINLTFAHLQAAIGLSSQAFSTTVAAMFEVHLGAFQLSELVILPIVWQVALLSALFAWSGVSAHIQVQSIARKAGLRYRSFLTARLLHTAVAFFITFLLWKPLDAILPNITPSYLSLQSDERFSVGWLSSWTTVVTVFVGGVICLTLLSLISRVVVQIVRRK